ncbi:CLAVATA3/ESR (CLE)-related protein 25 [Abrus precatorius]|uniref:CLAVATA3/ESR (CLE)-related protein 25 n=1 Tax=Abrus precatorius TaxID=3816 RepID=A0A8B8M2Q0_ABRPR|nr:CLAVATA3/ESR (CLE)-related protein 25 [Abrus precatorius]
MSWHGEASPSSYDIKIYKDIHITWKKNYKEKNLHMGTSTSFFLPRFFRALAVVGLVCLLVLGSLGSGEGTRQPTTQWSDERVKHEQVLGRDKPVNRAELDFNYMSKRRVPNGPDPIHNRRAGNSGRPPGQA